MSEDNHRHICICSCIDSGNFLGSAITVPVCSYRADARYLDKTCVIEMTEMKGLTRKSFVYYANYKRLDQALWQEWCKVIIRGTCDENLLKKVIAGAKVSLDIPIEIKSFLV